MRNNMRKIRDNVLVALLAVRRLLWEQRIIGSYPGGAILTSALLTDLTAAVFLSKVHLHTNAKYKRVLPKTISGKRNLATTTRSLFLHSLFKLPGQFG